MAFLSLIIAWSGWDLNRGPLAPKESALPLSYGSTPGNQPFSWQFRLQELLFQLQQINLILFQLQQINLFILQLQQIQLSLIHI